METLQGQLSRLFSLVRAALSKYYRCWVRVVYSYRRKEHMINTARNVAKYVKYVYHADGATA